MTLNEIKINIDDNKTTDKKLTSNKLDSIMDIIIDNIENNHQIDDEECKHIENDISSEKQHIDWDKATTLLNVALLSEKPSIWIEIMRKSGVLKLILPELLEGYGCDQNEFHLYDVYYHLLYSCDGSEKLLHIRMAALFHDVGKPRSRRTKIKNGIKSNTFYGHEIIGAKMFSKFIKRFNYDKEFVKTVTLLIRYHMFHYTKEWTDSAVRRFVKSVGDDFLNDLFLLREADRRGSGKKSDTCEEIEIFKKRIKVIQEQEAAPKVTDLVIGGSEIMSRYNMKPGRIIGDTLKYLLTKVVEKPELNNENDLFNIADKFIEEQGMRVKV